MEGQIEEIWRKRQEYGGIGGHCRYADRFDAADSVAVGGIEIGCIFTALKT